MQVVRFSHKSVVIILTDGRQTDGGTAITYPYTPSGNVTLYALLGAGNGATITGLGSQSPSTVTFNVDSGFFASVVKTNYTKSGDRFTKFKKVYRKVNTAEDGQITSITLADTKVDNTYQIYPCFLAEDGAELEYVLMGKILQYIIKQCKFCKRIGGNNDN